MVSKKVVAAVAAGALAGGAGVMLAGGTGTASAAPAATSATHHTAKAGHHRGHRGAFGGRVLHGTAVVKTKTGTETIAFDRGTVTAISATSVTVTASDKFAETFAITSTSKTNSAKVGDTAAALGVVDGSTTTLKVLRVKKA